MIKPVKTVVSFAVPANIRRTMEERRIVILALPARTSVIPQPQPNMMKHPIVPFVVRVNIRQPPEEQPIAIFVLLENMSAVLVPAIL
jgi:hypothetical protein